jgi:mannitol-1-/sugar-/sorbitol-6-phosphatase
MTSSVLLTCGVVLFDNDGVLVDSDASVDRAWSRWAVEQGLDPAEVVPLAHGQRAADTVTMLVAPELRAHALARIDALELADAASVCTVPGARALLESMPADRWAVVTSGTSALARARLAAAGLPQPQVLITADDVSLGKPDPEGYLAAAAALGVAPRDTLVVEDSGNGIRAARAAGTGTVLGVGPRALATDADVVVPDLTGVGWLPDGLAIDPDRSLRFPATAP